MFKIRHLETQLKKSLGLLDFSFFLPQLKPIQIFSKPLSTYNQQLWLTCVVELDQSKGMKPDTLE